MLLVYMYIEVNYTGYLIVQVQKIGISRGKNVFHGFHGWIVDFTGLPQKQPISRTRDTVKKEGPWIGQIYEPGAIYLRNISALSLT